jgi:hypothetical protein
MHAAAANANRGDARPCTRDDAARGRACTNHGSPGVAGPNVRWADRVIERERAQVSSIASRDLLSHLLSDRHVVMLVGGAHNVAYGHDADSALVV